MWEVPNVQIRHEFPFMAKLPVLIAEKRLLVQENETKIPKWKKVEVCFAMVVNNDKDLAANNEDLYENTDFFNTVQKFLDNNIRIVRV